MTRARVAITVVFALNGLLFASIFSRLPAVKERAGLGAGALGAALLCSMLGLLLSQIAAGPLVTRSGSRPFVLAGALGYAIGLVPVALSQSFAALAGSFLFVGLANGLLDVAMNVHGIISALGYCGFLAGPPAVGGLAELAGLRAGLVIVALLCAVAGLLAPAVRAPVRSR